MSSSRSLPLRRVLTSATLVVLAAALWMVLPSRTHRDANATADPHAMHGPMTDAAMQRWVTAWFADHPARGQRSLDAPSDSFVANNFYFDENGDGPATQVDTAKIFEGQTILWKWQGGGHTVTSGTGALDPQAGVLFDQPLNNVGGGTTFSFQFNNVGTFDFFCRPHEGFGMKGVVVVKSLVAVDPAPGGGRVLGFLSSPFPNPTHGTTSFRFALDRPGRARADVFDVRGARIATVLDRDLTAGAWDAAWDARSNGTRVAPGVFYLELTLPGRTETRTIVVSR